MQPPDKFDVNRIRQEFPLLQRRVHGRPLIWLDNAATTQKPHSVIDRIVYYYAHENSNIHSGIHTLALEADAAYEGARANVAAFLNAEAADEIVFVRGATEGLNLLAAILGESLLKSGDEIVLTEAEQVQLAAKRAGAAIRVAPVDDNGDILLEVYARLLGPRTRIVSLTHVSNATGAVMPIDYLRRAIGLAARYGFVIAADKILSFEALKRKREAAREIREHG